MLKYKKRGFTHRSEEHTSELQSRPHLVCRLLLEKKKPGGSLRQKAHASPLLGLKVRMCRTGGFHRVEGSPGEARNIRAVPVSASEPSRSGCRTPVTEYHRRTARRPEPTDTCASWRRKRRLGSRRLKRTPMCIDDRRILGRTEQMRDGGSR